MEIVRAKFFCAVLILAATIVPLAPLNAQTNEPPRILFLHLKLKGQAISLVNATAVPGVLKPARTMRGGIRYEIISTNGVRLWQGAMADPRVERPDFPALDDSDKTPRPALPRPDELEFTLRVPCLPAAQRIDFYTLEPPPSGDVAATNAVKKILGSLPLTTPAKPAR